MSGRYRFVDPDVDRIDLTDGDWIEVKRELTFKEEEQLAAAGLKTMHTGTGEIGIDWQLFNLMRIELWLTDWSFHDKQGKPKPLNRENIQSLRSKDAREILTALDKHVEAASELKNEIPTTEPVSVAT